MGFWTIWGAGHSKTAFEVTILMEKEVITLVSTFLNIQNQILGFRPKISIFLILCAKNASKWLLFPHKMRKSKNFSLKPNISFWMFRKVEINVITSISINIVTSNAVFGYTASHILEKPIFQKLTIPSFYLHSHRRQRYVDQKVNRCCPKFLIRKYALSAFCGYLYGF